MGFSLQAGSKANRNNNGTRIFFLVIMVNFVFVCFSEGHETSLRNAKVKLSLQNFDTIHELYQNCLELAENQKKLFVLTKFAGRHFGMLLKRPGKGGAVIEPHHLANSVKPYAVMPGICHDFYCLFYPVFV